MTKVSNNADDGNRVSFQAQFGFGVVDWLLMVLEVGLPRLSFRTHFTEVYLRVQFSLRDWGFGRGRSSFNPHPLNSRFELPYGERNGLCLGPLMCGYEVVRVPKVDEGEEDLQEQLVEAAVRDAISQLPPGSSEAEAQQAIQSALLSVGAAPVSVSVNKISKVGSDDDVGDGDDGMFIGSAGEQKH